MTNYQYEDKKTNNLVKQVVGTLSRRMGLSGQSESGIKMKTGEESTGDGRIQGSSPENSTKTLFSNEQGFFVTQWYSGIPGKKLTPVIKTDSALTQRMTLIILRFLAVPS